MKSVRTIRNNSFKGDFSGKYRRMHLLAFSVFFAFGLVFFRLFSIQALEAGTYKGLAENQHKMRAEIEASRGEIFLSDENGLYPLAVNRQFLMAYAVPKEMDDGGAAARELSSILGIEEEILKKKFSDSADPFEIVKKKLSDDEVNRIKEKNIKGIRLLPEVYRYYPGGNLASHVTGFVGSDGEKTRGIYGMESFWEEDLKGERGIISQERDSAGRWISVSDRDFQPAKNGSNLVLTINHAVQYEIEKILKETIEKHEAGSGSVIVMEPKSGKVLGIANYPDFNPNEYSKVEDVAVFNNPTISTPYEPGSIFKPLTMAMGIDDGKVSPDTEFVDSGSVYEAGYKIKNSEGKVYGRQTMTQVLEESINTGVIFVEKLIGNQKFLEYAKNFGFGEKTGIDLGAESAGNISNIEKTNRNINFFTASFGQGISITPLQIITAFSALANKGKLMKPQIVERIIHSDGTEEKVEPKEVRQVVSEETSKLVGQMLRSVVLNGHGKRADVPGYLVGGKTGTAQVAKVGSSGYEEGLTVGSFAGYAPLQDPQFAVLVKIFDPKDVQWAESTAAPAFGKVMKFLLEYHKVRPTEDLKISPMYKTLYGNSVVLEQDKENKPIEAEREKKKD